MNVTKIRNSGKIVYLYTSTDDIDKIQRVENNTLEQEEVPENIESEVIKKVKEDES